MKLRLWATVWALALVVTPMSFEAQNRPSNAGTQATKAPAKFDDHARQTTQDWYSQHKTKPPAGLRDKDKLTPDQESRLQPGKPLDSDLRKRVHPVPADLSRQLPPPPPDHRYVAVGQHLGLVDSVSLMLEDLIHLH